MRFGRPKLASRPHHNITLTSCVNGLVNQPDNMVFLITKISTNYLKTVVYQHITYQPV